MTNEHRPERPARPQRSGRPANPADRAHRAGARPVAHEAGRRNDPRQRAASSRTSQRNDPRQRAATSRASQRTPQRADATSASRRAPQRTPQRYQRRRSLWPRAVAVVAIAAVVLFAGTRAFGALFPGDAQGPDITTNDSIAITAEDGMTANDTAASVEDAAEPGPITVTLTFAGDCTLGTEPRFDQSRAFPAVYESKGPDYFFANVRDILTADDLTVANCEGVLTNEKTREDKEYAYKGKPEYAGLFAEGGIDAVSLENNHSRDYGEASYTDTLAALEDAGVTAFGDDIIAYEDVKGVKVALIGKKMISAPLSQMQPEVVDAIHEAQDNGAQIIVVFMHWGIMREYTPTDDMMTLGHAAIDAGATIVLGAHQHVVQGYEEYKGRFIVYGLGNFCYGGSLNLRDPDCYLFQQTFTVEGDTVKSDGAIDVIPCLISSSDERNNYQPTPAEGSDKERIEKKIADSSANIASRSA